MEKVKNTFRLHVVDANLYRIRFQNTGIAGEVTEVPHIDILNGGVNLGVGKLVFDNIQFSWVASEIGIHEGYVIEDQAGGKKLDFFLGDFDLPDNGDLVISPDTWGPTTTSNDCMEVDDTTYYDAYDSTDLLIGDYSGNYFDIGLKFESCGMTTGCTVDSGSKIDVTAGSYGSHNGGCNAVIEMEDSRTPVNYDSSHRPSQRSYHGDADDWDADVSSGDFSSGSDQDFADMVQPRVADDYETGDDVAFRWRTLDEDAGSYQSIDIDDATLTVVYTPAAGGEQRATAGVLPAMTGILARKFKPKRLMEGVI